jgi:Tol biopolymer transport system component
VSRSATAGVSLPARSRARCTDGVSGSNVLKLAVKMHRDGGFSDPPSVQAPPDDDRGTRLESWKEIADYLRRGMTTVQRWEHEEGLPVHRHDHTKKGSVYSYARELDEWRACRERTLPATPEPTPSADAKGISNVDRLGGRRLGLTVAGILALTVAVVIVLWVQPWHRVRADAPRVRVRPLANEPEIEDNASLSPDGRFVIYHWHRERGGSGLFIKDVDGGQVRRLTGGLSHEQSDVEDDYAAWSPTGDLIAFLRGRHERRRDVILVSPLGAGPERKVADADGISLSWMPDGRRIAMVDRLLPGEAFAVFLVSIETGERVRLTSPPVGWWGDTFCALSPDGRMLAFVRFQAPNAADLFITPTNGGEPRRLTADGGVSRLAWTPDGQGIVFASFRGGSTRLWHVPVTSPGRPEPALVTGPEGGATSPTFSRRGKSSPERFVYTHDYDDVNVWQATAASGWRPLAVANSTAYDDQPAISPDGARFAFASNRTGSNEIWIANLDGSNPRQLTSMGGAMTSGPRWSPDGRRLVFASHTANNGDIYVIAADGTSMRRLTTQPSNESRPSWSSDGRSIYFTSNRSGVDHIWRMPVDGSDPAIDVTKSAAIEGYESADGRLLYFVRNYDLGGIMSVPVDGGPQTLVVPGVHHSFWASTRAGLVYLTVHETPGTAKPAIRLFDPKSKTARDLGVLPSIASRLKPGFAASPDAGTIWWCQTDARLADLVLIESWVPPGAPR